MGLRVYVYKNPLGDCTNRGISSKVTQLTLVNVDGPFDPAPDAPAAVLLKNHYETLRIVPAGDDGQAAKGWFMHGGNIADSSDSRFSEACIKLLGHRYGAVDIHDRQE